MLLSNQHDLYPHVTVHRNYVGDPDQFICGRKRILTCKTCVEGKQIVYAERQTQPGFNCQMQSSSVIKDHT